MRDFERDVSSAAGWNYSVPAGEPSWSLARARLFESCQRAYFLCHFMSQGGWDQYSHPLVRQCYIEKRLLSCAEWIDDVLNDAIRIAIDRTLHTPDGKREQETQRLFQFEVARRISEGAVQLRNREWERDTKCLNLFETYYGTGQAGSEAFEAASRCLRTSAKAFSLSDPMLGLLSVERNDWRRLHEFESFRLHGVEVWTSPSLSWVVEGRACFLEIRMSLPEPDAAALSAGLLDLLAFHRFKTPSNSSIVSYVAPDSSGLNAVPDSLAIRAMIPKSNSAMTGKMHPDGRMWIEDFPKCPDDKKCANCRFKGICAKTQ